MADKDMQEQKQQADFEAEHNKESWLEQKIIDLGDESWDEQIKRVRQVIEDNPKELKDQVKNVDTTIQVFFHLPDVYSILSYAIEKEAEAAWEALQEAE